MRPVPNIRSSLTLCCTLLGAACGGTDPLAGGVGRTAPPPEPAAALGMQRVEFARVLAPTLPLERWSIPGSHRVVDEALTPLAAPAEAVAHGALVEWTRKTSSLAALRDVSLAYVERGADGTAWLFLARWDGSTLVKDALFDGTAGAWKDVRGDGEVVSPQGHERPLRFWAPALGASVEVDDCTERWVDGELRFDCVLGPRTRVSLYHPERVSSEEATPRSLFCLERCIDPDAPAYDPYFATPPAAPALPPAALGHAYRVGSGPVLYLDEQPVERPDDGQWNVASGFLFAPTPENLAALTCDLDHDGVAAETCAHKPLERFYTWSTSLAPEARAFGRGLR